MDDASAGAAFPVTRCATCGKDVLCYLHLDEAPEGAVESARCVECATAAAPAAVRWVDLHELEDIGYGFAVPDEGCGRPDCRRGRCNRADR